MTQNIDERKLLEDLKKYRDQKGYDGLFGLIAKLAPDKVDKEDVENYTNLAPSVTSNIMPTATINPEQLISSAEENNLVMEASIYAEEHIPAVQDDLIEHGQIDNKNDKNEIETYKVRVLEPEMKSPNPWGDAEIVSPGDLKL